MLLPRPAASFLLNLTDAPAFRFPKGRDAAALVFFALQFHGTGDRAEVCDEVRQASLEALPLPVVPGGLHGEPLHVGDGERELPGRQVRVCRRNVLVVVGAVPGQWSSRTAPTSLRSRASRFSRSRSTPATSGCKGTHPRGQGRSSQSHFASTVDSLSH